MKLMLLYSLSAVKFIHYQLYEADAGVQHLSSYNIFIIYNMKLMLCAASQQLQLIYSLIYDADAGVQPLSCFN